MNTVDLKLEVVAIPVADVERARRFYGDSLSWRLDADFAVGDDFRVVQFTPPGSPCSIHFGKGVTAAAPGSASGLFLVVTDIVTARTELMDRGVAVSEMFHRAGPGKPAIDGPDPQRRSYSPLLPSAIRTATAGCSRKSRSDCLDELKKMTQGLARWPIWRTPCAAQRPRTESTRSAPVSEMLTGPAGTPPT